jgi:hypothetical protein
VKATKEIVYSFIREHSVEQLYASSQPDRTCKCRFKPATQHCHAPLKSSKETNGTLMMELHHLSQGLLILEKRRDCVEA